MYSSRQNSFHHPQEAFLAQFILYVHNGRLIPHSLHFIFSRQRHAESDVIEHFSSRYIMSLFYYKHHFVLNRYDHFSQNYGHVINDCRENLRFHLNLQFNYFLKIEKLTSFCCFALPHHAGNRATICHSNLTAQRGRAFKSTLLPAYRAFSVDQREPNLCQRQTIRMNNQLFTSCR